jgi:hypothetical protein
VLDERREKVAIVGDHATASPFPCSLKELRTTGIETRV